MTEQEYFKKHFVISELLVEKDLIAQKMWLGDDSAGYLNQGHYKAKRDIEILNGWICEEEHRLRQDVRKSEEAGRVFSFERFARERDMGNLERRLVLFFLHLDLYCAGHVAFPRRRLASIMDCDGDPMTRSKVLLDLSQKGFLFKKGVISQAEDSSEVRLAVIMRDALRKLVSGEEIPCTKQIGQDQRTECDVGHICQPEYGMDDVILPEHIKTELLLHLNTNGRLAELGVLDKVKRGRGFCMLFYGPPGTGKSMLSHAVAQHLKKKVLQVGVSRIHSKWSGECEKNIVRLFKTAKDEDAVLCLDEADSLVFDRKDAQRAFEIAQVNAFLEEVERFDGVLIMTTNLEGKIDSALERRVALRVRLGAPAISIREKIWRNHIPGTLRVDDDINWRGLAERYTFSGGYIKNAVLSALRYMIARNSEALAMDDLIYGAESELKGMLNKTGKGPIGFAMK